MPSTTQVELRETYGDRACLLRVMPLTGRRHQIRIHLSEQGYPLLGDSQYGGPAEQVLPKGALLRVGRVALHAAKLELPTREVFEAAWPADFREWVEQLRGQENE
jgi:23S rRNA-/tRNA-specific pseudouridylate synthase